MIIRPHPGAQERFLACTADIAVGGGSAGGGKSLLLLLEAMRNVRVPGYNAIVFRRHATELQGGGSIWDEAAGLYPAAGGVPRETPRLEYKFRTAGSKGARIEFSHLQYDKDVHAHQSKQYAFIGYDEACQFTAKQFWYLFSRNRSTCGVVPYQRLATNPDPDSYLAELIAWWIDEETGYPIPERDGAVRWFIRLGDDLRWADSPEVLRKKFPDIPNEDFHPKSFAFVAFGLDDNPTMAVKDPAYRGNLLALGTVERERLLKGNWKIRPAAGLYFNRAHAKLVERVPDDVTSWVRFWDLAATEPSPANPDPDWTRGVLMGRRKSGEIVIADVKGLRGSPGAVERLVCATTEQDAAALKNYTAAMFQDPGQAGKQQAFHFRRLLEGYPFRTLPATTDKVTNASPLSARWEAGDVCVVRGTWNAPYLAELDGFPDAKHDDAVDASAGAYLTLTRKPQVGALDTGRMGAIGGARESA